MNGVLYGLGAAMPIGPVNVEIGRRTLRGGFGAGASLGCGAVTVDVTYALLYCVGVARLTQFPWFYWPLAVIGVLVLATLGIMSLRSAWRNLVLPRTEDPFSQIQPASIRAGYFTGILMTATNPMTIAFWFTALPKKVDRMTGQPWRDLPIICIGVLLGALGWVIVFAGLLSLAGNRRKPWWFAAVDAIGGAMLLGLAIISLLRAMAGPL